MRTFLTNPLKDRVYKIRSAARRFDLTAVCLHSDFLYKTLGVDRTVTLLDSLDKLNPWYPFEARSVYLNSKNQSQLLRCAIEENKLRNLFRKQDEAPSGADSFWGDIHG